MLEYRGLRFNNKKRVFSEFYRSFTDLKSNNYSKDDLFDFDFVDNLMVGMITCHSLKRIDEENLGDSLDLEMFNFTKWKIQDYDKITDQRFSSLLFPPEYGLNKDFFKTKPVISYFGVVSFCEFLPAYRRFSVIIQRIYKNHSENIDISKECVFEVFTKGAPETIYNICDPSSSTYLFILVPTNFYEILNYHTRNGHRVIGMAKKSIKGTLNQIKEMDRLEIESNLKFLGFIVFENKLRDDCQKVMTDLKYANMKLSVCTGLRK